MSHPSDRQDGEGAAKDPGQATRHETIPQVASPSALHEEIESGEGDRLEGKLPEPNDTANATAVDAPTDQLLQEDADGELESDKGKG